VILSDKKNRQALSTRAKSVFSLMGSRTKEAFASSTASAASEQKA
jgi:hypothetical protein